MSLKSGFEVTACICSMIPQEIEPVVYMVLLQWKIGEPDLNIWSEMRSPRLSLGCRLMVLKAIRQPFIINIFENLYM